MLAKRLLVLDVETTGLDPSTDSIIQIASCVLSRKDLREERSFCTYVKPTVPISSDATAVHGLRDNDLLGAPSLSEAMQSFIEYAPKDSIICGHNVAFDVSFLRMSYQRAGLEYEFDYHTLDLWSIAFFILGVQRISLPTYNLTALCSLYGINRGARHDALKDVRATAAVLRRLFEAVKGFSDR
jgi:DNA polymerase III epsilon subunit family exonuclease